MIVARGYRDSKECLLLGLSQRNLDRLVDNKPMRLQSSSHPGIPEGLEIIILYGKTEKDIQDMLTKAGLIDKDTQITSHPRLNNET